jgi:cGMP-dependent protein kinase
LNCLKHHFIFSHLSEKELDNIKEHMFWVKMPEGTEIFRQGTIGSCFFIIERGSIDMQVDG